jgi:mono/diheme cytochrome c family protein
VRTRRVRARQALYILLWLLPSAPGCYHFAQLARLVGGAEETGAPPVYAERCSTCHGDAGRGDGLAGRGLDPAPRDFGDTGWQARTSDERVRRVIRSGGRAAGLSGGMAAHADLSDAELDTLVAYIRSVGERAAAGDR